MDASRLVSKYQLLMFIFTCNHFLFEQYENIIWDIADIFLFILADLYKYSIYKSFMEDLKILTILKPSRG